MLIFGQSSGCVLREHCEWCDIFFTTYEQYYFDMYVQKFNISSIYGL